MLMILEDLKMEILPAVFINKGFVNGEENCNYEKYLLELVNNSIYFRIKSNFEEYIYPKIESNGECDCISETYKMDFKLLESTTRFHASRELSIQIEKPLDGVIVYSIPKKDNTMRVTRLHAALREYNCEALNELCMNKYEYGTIENDIITYVKLLAKRKNILFLFPYILRYSHGYNFKYAIENIKMALEKDFKESYFFREKFYSGYDTYISYIYDDNLIICKFEREGKLKIVDVVYIFKSSVYQELHEYNFR